jgi:hypothetical protein
METSNTNTALHQYIEADAGFYQLYEAYDPDQSILAQIHAALPAAHVVTPSRYTCGDCIRNIPRMARIAESLPGWTWDVFDSDTNPERRAALGILRIPTFIVYDREGGRELGRIIENPTTMSLERDLLNIVQSVNDQPAESRWLYSGATGYPLEGGGLDPASE